MTGAMVIAEARRLTGGFLSSKEVESIAADPATRLELLLVRCNHGRFLAPAQDVAYFVGLVTNAPGDYVRDVTVCRNGGRSL